MGSCFSSTKRQRLNENGAFDEVAQPSENGAFDEVAQPSAFAYAPSSSTQTKLRYDVFINHRGPDCKHTLAKDIYDKLSLRGVQVFLDDEALELGDSIPTQIQEAMDDAFLHIAIFSKRYAESPWCLAELSYMLKTGVTIIPVFYHVNPSDLRWVDKGGIYAGSFAQHETKGRYTAKKLGDWKEALQTVSYITGYILNNDDWGWVLEGVGKRVMAMRKAQVAEPTNALGLEERVEEIEEMIQGESVHVVGIVGMGGCGKTTLAKKLFNSKSSSFSRCSFLYGVRDGTSKDQLCGLQKKLLGNLRIKCSHGNEFSKCSECSQIESIEEGKDLLAKHSRSLRALIVLDDVDHTEQIDSLLPAKDMLALGSIIIITTRYKEVLTSWRISKSSIYEMKGLRECHAKKLFCLHAFQNPDAPDGFEDLVERALKSCQGLPLSLKVFGGQLCFKPRDYWEPQLNEISRVLPEGIISSLKISYDALDTVEQERFLDVACFFIGEPKRLALQLWDGLGTTKGVYSWETLQNRCLVELDEENRIRMHDHLRDLGRDIANKKSPYRMWFEGQINNIQTQPKERMQVRGIMAATTSFYGDRPYSSSHYPPPFEECVEVMGGSNPRDASLKYLVFNDEHFNVKIGELSRGLVWLRCFNFNHADLSSCLSLGSLRVLELYDVECLETIWENNANIPLQLRELIIRFTYSRRGLYLQELPLSIERLKHLEKIVIHAASITSLPNEFCNLNALQYLELRDCRELSSLPNSFGNLRNLWHIDLNECCRINTLPLSFKQLTNLRYLSLSLCSELTFNSENSSILENMTKLEYVNFSYCKLEILPRHIANQPSVTTLHIQGQHLTNLPDNIGQLKKLEVLRIGGPFFTSLPDSFSNLFSLKELDISHCQNLKSLPAFVGLLNALEMINLEFTGVKSLPETFGQLTNLRKLQIIDCPIRDLAFGLGSRESLNKLREITLIETQLSTISISEDCCPSLETLELCDNKCLTGIETLPKTVKQLKLISNSEIGALSSLEHLRSLETLRAETEWEVPGIESLEHMQSLKTLELSANNFASLEPCIRTITKWPSEMNVWARARARDGVESIINDFAFGKLGRIDSFTEEADKWKLTRPDMQPSDAAILCFVIQCPQDNGVLFIRDGEGLRCGEAVEFKFTIEYERWVWISVRDSSTIENGYQIYKEDSDVIIKRGTLVVGEKECVIEAFKKLLVFLKGYNLKMPLRRCFSF